MRTMLKLLLLAALLVAMAGVATPDDPDETKDDRTGEIILVEQIAKDARNAPRYPAPPQTHHNTGFNGLDMHHIMQVQRFPAVRVKLELAGKPQPVQLADGTIVVAGFVEPPTAKLSCVTVQWSVDNARTFSKPKLFEKMPGRTCGLTLLRDGTLVLAHGDKQPCVSRSEDGGHNWTTVNLPADIVPDNGGPLKLGEVSGLVELPDGTLLMHIARQFKGQYKWTAYVIRSSDGGRTWGDPTRVPTETDADEISYELLPSGRIFGIARCSGAFIHRNKLADVVPGGPGAPLTGEPSDSAAMFFSDDLGRTWSKPQPTGLGVLQAATYPLQLRDGRLILLIGHRVFPFGVQAVASRDGGKTFDLEHPLVLAWHSWSYYCGHPRSIQLKDGSILTGYYTQRIAGHPPHHNDKCTGELVRWRPPDNWPPIKNEQSHVVSARQLASQTKRVDVPDHRWVVKQPGAIRPQDVGLEERISIYPEGLTTAANGDLLLAVCCPEKMKTFIMRSADRGKTWAKQGVVEHTDQTGYVEGMTRTHSGRLMLIYYSRSQKLAATKPGDLYYRVGGNNYRFAQHESNHWGAWSDDEGKTWYKAPIDLSPFKAMDAQACGKIFQTQDGTLVASFRGHITQEELNSGITGCGIIRSHDDGKTWGDASPIHRAIPGSGHWFNENQVLPLADGRWLAMIRLNNNNLINSTPLIMHRSYSLDQGRTWSFPVPTRFSGGEPGAGLLPDGGIVCAQTASGRTYGIVWREDKMLRGGIKQDKPWGLLYEVSYDGGLTWAYWGDLYRSEEGSAEHIGSPTFLAIDENNVLAVYHRGSKELSAKYRRVGPYLNYGPQFIGTCWLGKVATDDPLTESLRSPCWANPWRTQRELHDHLRTEPPDA